MHLVGFLSTSREQWGPSCSITPIFEKTMLGSHFDRRGVRNGLRGRARDAQTAYKRPPETSMMGLFRRLLYLSQGVPRGTTPLERLRRRYAIPSPTARRVRAPQNSPRGAEIHQNPSRAASCTPSTRPWLHFASGLPRLRQGLQPAETVGSGLDQTCQNRTLDAVPVAGRPRAPIAGHHGTHRTHGGPYDAT